MNLVQATNTATPVTFGGEPFRVRQLKLREWAGLHAWLASSRSSPVLAAALAIAEAARIGKPFSLELKDHLLEQAHEELRHWPPTPGTQAWLSDLCRTFGGERLFYRTIFEAAGCRVPDDDRLDELIQAATEAEVVDVVRLSYFGDPPDPKAGDPGVDSGTDSEVGSRDSDDWGPLFHGLTSGGFGKGWTYADVAELTFPQLRNELTGGKTEVDRKASRRQVLDTLARFRSGELTF